MEWIDQARMAWDELAPLLLALLVAMTVLVQALRPIARWLAVKAASTPNTTDDAAADAAVRALDAAARWLDRAQAYAPRIGIGRRQDLPQDGAR